MMKIIIFVFADDHNDDCVDIINVGNTTTTVIIVIIITGTTSIVRYPFTTRLPL